MAYPVTLNGRTYTLADFEGQNYVDGLPDAFEDFVTHAGNLYSTTSTTSNSIGIGSKTFTVESSKPYQVGTPLRITDSAAPSTNWIDAIVTAYSGTTLTVDAVAYAGSGTKTSWNINIGGGGTSYTGTLPIAQGGTGATTAAAARTNLDVYSKSEADGRYLNISGDTADISFGANMTFGDNNKAIFGAGSDLQIYHNGSHSYINEGGTGNLRILAENFTVRNPADNESMIIAAPDSGVTLYYDNAPKLATTATGVDITGTKLDITGSGNTDIYLNTGNNLGDNSRIFFGDTADIDTGYLSYDHGTNSMTFGVNGTVERMRLNSDGSVHWKPNGTTQAMTLDASGNLLVGKTSDASAVTTDGINLRPDGYSTFTATSKEALQLARQGTDGDIVDFYKDGGSVGSIGVAGGDLYISGGSSHAGIRFDTNILTPAVNGTQTDATVDLGYSSRRFKDLYLSGGVYLGGTGSANHLDDYEEGTWTPVYGGDTTDPTVTYVGQVGRYRKIGEFVWATCYIEGNCSGGSGGLYVAGLPFTPSGALYQAGAVSYVGGWDTNKAPTMVLTSPSSARALLYRPSTSDSRSSSERVQAADTSSSPASQVYFMVCYTV